MERRRLQLEARRRCVRDPCQCCRLASGVACFISTPRGIGSVAQEKRSENERASGSGSESENGSANAISTPRLSATGGVVSSAVFVAAAIVIWIESADDRVVARVRIVALCLRCGRGCGRGLGLDSGGDGDHRGSGIESERESASGCEHESEGGGRGRGENRTESAN